LQPLQVNEIHYQKVNAVNLVFEESVGGVAACLFFGDFGPETHDLGLQSLNALFQFGYGNGIEIFTDNHAGGLFWCIVKVHGSGFLCFRHILPLQGRGLQPIVGKKGILRMKAIEISQPGGPEVLRLSELPMPQPGGGQVLVKVHAAGVNRPDILQRQGGYPPPPGAPLTPGLEIAGEVMSAGARYRIGDKVCALVPGGGYAEYAVVAEDNALPVPSGFSMIEAAAIPETYFTVWTNVFERGRLQAAETSLIHGGSSGIGTTAIQLAKAFGSRVIVTAGSDGKCADCLSLGADVAINYKTQDFVEVLKERAMAPDVILDMVGGDYVARNLRCIAMHGRIVNIAFQKGSKVEVDLLPIMLKRLTLTGSTLRPRSVAEKAEIARALEAKVWPLFAAGKCKPAIFKTFPLADAAGAQRLMESSQHVGKIVLTA
jgi:NADPH2:quinone reductase